MLFTSELKPLPYTFHLFSAVWTISWHVVASVAVLAHMKFAKRWMFRGHTISASFLTRISASSPRKFSICIIYKNLFWIKVSKKYFIKFWNRKHCIRYVWIDCMYGYTDCGHDNEKYWMESHGVGGSVFRDAYGSKKSTEDLSRWLYEALEW